MPNNSLSLYQIEEGLQAFADTEDGGVPEELKDEFAVELAAAVEQAVEKRDNVIRFIRHLEMQAAAAKVEKNRLAELEKRYKAGLEQLKSYVVGVIERHVPEPKRGSRKLEGSIGVLSLRKLPDTVELSEDDDVPAEFQDVTVKLSGQNFENICSLLADSDVYEVERLRASATFTPRKADIKKALKAGEEIPGADLRYGENGLVIK